jgi:hypothetical protein
MTPLQKQSREIALKIIPLLKDKDPNVQCIVLANLVSLWLIGCQSVDPDKQTEERIDMLEYFYKLVVRLVPVNEKNINKAQAAKATKQ